MPDNNIMVTVTSEGESPKHVKITSSKTEKCHGISTTFLKEWI